MQKEFILLTKSRKFNNYCIAGVELETGNWIRLVSTDAEIQCAVPKEDFTYENTNEAQILDIVSFNVANSIPLYYQPENIQYDSGFYWSKTGTTTLIDVLNRVQQKPDPYIFYNTDKRVKKSYITDLNDRDIYSLKIIYLDSVNLQAKQWSPDEKIKYNVSFTYNGYSYNYIKVTDDDFVKQFTIEGYYTLNNVALVLSLADLYEVDQCHHKLVAAIIR